MAQLAAGRALDVGCGTGASAAWLAGQGWAVTAVDLVPRAVALASARWPDAQVDWLVADVTRWARTPAAGRLAGLVGLVVDDRCVHGLTTEQRKGWAATVNAVAAAGATLLIAAAPARRTRSALGPQGMDGVDIARLLGERWRQLPSPGPGWHEFRRAA